MALKTRSAGTSPVQAVLRLPEIGMSAQVQPASLSMLQAHIAALEEGWLGHKW